MQTKIYCRPVAQDVHEFYLVADGDKYYLFEQRFVMANHLYFKGGVAVEDLGNFSKATAVTVRNTLEKLPKYVKKIEKRYGLNLLQKKARPKMRPNTKEKYKNAWLSEYEQVA